MKRTGVFDNEATMQREWYYKSEKPYETLSALAISAKPEAGGLSGLVKPFWTFPDLPPAPPEDQK